MRWFKHLTETRQDEKMARLIAEGGATAYGIWWMAREAVARQIQGGEEKCSVTYPVSKWATELSVRGSHVRQWLSKLAVTGLVTVEWKDSEATVTIPNLLKYRDEWQHRLGSHSGARIQNQIQKQKQSTGSASRAPEKQVPHLSEAEQRLLAWQQSGAALTAASAVEPPSKEEQKQIADRVWKQLEETPEGKKVLAS